MLHLGPKKKLVKANARCLLEFCPSLPTYTTRGLRLTGPLMAVRLLIRRPIRSILVSTYAACQHLHAAYSEDWGWISRCRKILEGCLVGSGLTCIAFAFHVSYVL